MVNVLKKREAETQERALEVKPFICCELGSVNGLEPRHGWAWDVEELGFVCEDLRGIP